MRCFLLVWKSQGLDIDSFVHTFPSLLENLFMFLCHVQFSKVDLKCLFIVTLASATPPVGLQTIRRQRVYLITLELEALHTGAR